MVEMKLAKPVDYELTELINKVREDPQSLISDLEAMLPNFDGLYYVDPNKPYKLITNEGASAV